ncbi:LSU ribosomal protein L5p (L11e) [Candidatus Vidania fulgoroideae]|nr:LSU ribosomal protein L5p (L11e) [Candidatus Vidania fulgoroideae]
MIRDFRKYVNESINKLFKKEYKNVMMYPKLLKLIFSSSFGLKGGNKKFLNDIFNDFYLITGQKPVFIKSKKSVSNFGIRKGMISSIKTTLRNKSMFNFINKFINISAPRIKDFCGFKNDNVDYYGNFNFGYDDHTIFPEFFLDENKINSNKKGFTINISIKNLKREDSIKLLKSINFPFINV